MIIEGEIAMQGRLNRFLTTALLLVALLAPLSAADASVPHVIMMELFTATW